MSVLASIPIHPLLVHVPVVLLPLAALGAVALVIRQKWVQHYGWLVVGGVVVAFGGSVLASGSGDDLLEQYQSSGQHISSTLNSHAELGESVQWIALLYAKARELERSPEADGAPTLSKEVTAYSLGEVGDMCYFLP